MPSRLSRDDFIAMATSVHGCRYNYSRVVYKNKDTKVEIMCEEHGAFLQTPHNHVRNKANCPKCSSKVRAEFFARTQEEYARDLFSVHGDKISVLGTYVNKETKIKHRCNVCGNEFYSRPGSIVRGSGCAVCAHKTYGAALMRTHDEYVRLVEDMHGGRLLVVGVYAGDKAAIEHRCTVCNHMYSPRPCVILNGHGCPKCAFRRVSDLSRLSQEEYDARLRAKHGGAVVAIGQYNGIDTRIPHLYSKCGHTVKISPYSALKNKTCSACIYYTDESYRIKIAKVSNGEVDVIGNYSGGNIKIPHRCNKHDIEWLAAPSSILNHHGCPLCGESVGERIVRRILDKNSVDYIQEHAFEECRNKLPLKFDFYIPNFRGRAIVLEYHGQQHYYAVDWYGGRGALVTTRFRDKIKYDYAQDRGYKYICLPFWQAHVAESVIQREFGISEDFSPTPYNPQYSKKFKYKNAHLGNID